MSRSRPTTPIRRVSRGSISSHHRASVSGAGSAVTPLSFLTQAMSDLSYETSTLHSNLECIEEIDNALLTFDESFSMFLYGLRMNAFCVEWPEAPGEENFERLKERKERRGDMDLLEGQNTAGFGDETVTADVGMSIAGDQTYMTQDEDEAELMQRKPFVSGTSNASKQPLKSALKKAGSDAASTTARATKPAATMAGPTKGRITAAEKRKREAKAVEIIETLPLEYRGGDPKPGQLAKSVILALIAAGEKGVRIAEIVKMPDLPQAKINKCMIALVTAKHVIKRSDNGVVYQLNPARHDPIA
ncbi:hypothetical protein CBS101457_001187 [Exobasidium rhododendri]|nr:hypothetical protein CBS101457_001187 [Exobasidium rhododendri]